MNEFYLVENYLKDKKIYYTLRGEQLILNDFMDMNQILKLILFLKENDFSLFNGVLSHLTIIKNLKK